MPLIVLDVHETGERLSELLDGVLKGDEILLTHFGAPFAMVSLRHAACANPPPWLRKSMLESLGELMESFRDEARPRLWGLN